MADWGPCYTALTWLADGERAAGVSLDVAVDLSDLSSGKIQTLFRVDEPL